MPNTLTVSLIWPGRPRSRDVADTAASLGGGITDEALFARVCRSNDHAAFGELVARYRGRVNALVRRMLAPAQTGIDPQDIAQEAFVDAYHRRGTFRHGSLVRPWLYGIAVHKCLDRLRASNREPTVEPLASDEETFASLKMTDDPLHHLIERQQIERLEFAVRALPPKLRAVLILRYMDDLSYEDIADACGLPLGTVKTQLFRARAELKRRMSDDADNL